MISHNFTKYNAQSFDIIITGDGEWNPFYKDYLYVDNTTDHFETVLWSFRPGKYGRVGNKLETTPLQALPDYFLNRVKNNKISKLYLVKKADDYTDRKLKNLSDNDPSVDPHQLYCTFVFVMEKPTVL